MRRPSMLPELAEHTVDRDTWQGMASARVPSAYPVPRIRLPRMLGGLKGVPPIGTPDTIDRIYRIDGRNSSSPLPVPITLEEGDAAAVVFWGATRRIGQSNIALASITIPGGWTLMERFDTGSLWSYAIASITNAPGGVHNFTYTVSGTPALIWTAAVGYRLGRSGGAPVGGSWHHSRGTSIATNQFRFHDVDPAWDVSWQEGNVTAPGTGPPSGLLPPVPPGHTAGGGAFWSYPWPNTSVLADYLAGEPRQDSAPTWAFQFSGSVGRASSVPLSFGWTP